ncbi:MAG TPA: hypothetical protein VMZ03_13725 [Chitinophagaceae bacterium]|nr:hypothetical protein [Chitinophagaceae bacterium]
MRRYTFAGFLLLLFCESFSQDSIPLLKGKINLSIREGTIECDLVLSNIPRIEDYFIRINSGMNIRYFKNVDPAFPLYYDRSFHDTTSTGETSAYYFPRNGGRDKYLPPAIHFRYAGKYPVFYDSLKDFSGDDWKGNISFNGYSLRTDGRQSAWYPVLYDVKKDIKFDKVKYDIEINCPDCSSLYVNGSVPVAGSKGIFKSDTPYEIAMFCGHYKISNQEGVYFLNPDITDKQIKEFGQITSEYKKYYAEKLSIPYNESVTYIQTTPTSESQAWLFVSWPTIVNIGRAEYGMKSFFDAKKGNWFKPFIAHELGHYYFGTYRRFNSELGDMINEGLSEYLSFKVTRKMISDSIYNKKIHEKIAAVQKFEAIPFGKIRSHADYQNRELYVYYYAPILFSAIEKEIGEPTMWRWLKALLETKTVFTNYSFLEETLRSVLGDNNKFESIRAKYFYSNNAIENAAAIIGDK